MQYKKIMMLFYFPRLVLLLLLPLLLLSQAVFASNGATLYEENCAICHGAEGRGGVGIPLALPSFLAQVSDEYLHRTIRIGRPGRVMPSFYWLSEKDIDQIVDYIGDWRTSPAPSYDDKNITGNALHGKIIYAKHCASCHGVDAVGGVGTGLMFSRPRDLPVTAPALNNQGFLNSATDQLMKRIIISGRKETPMPAASTFALTDTDVDDVVSYIRSFHKPLVLKKYELEDEPSALIYDSDYNFEETVENVKRAINGANFRWIRDQYLDHGLVEPGKENKKHLIIYFCNFNFLYEALNIDPRVGAFLPCRITIVENNGKVQLMTINPKHLSRLFNNDELNEACDKMHEIYSSIMEDATL
jgi:cytochrome c oxidase cbb3-type subunit 3